MPGKKYKRSKMTPVKYRIEHPTGFFNSDFDAQFCPGCGNAFGYLSRDFMKHVQTCPACRGKKVIYDEYGGMALVEE